MVEQLVAGLDRVAFAGHSQVPTRPILRLGRMVAAKIDALPVAITGGHHLDLSLGLQAFSRFDRLRQMSREVVGRIVVIEQPAIGMRPRLALGVSGIPAFEPLLADMPDVLGDCRLGHRERLDPVNVISCF